VPSGPSRTVIEVHLSERAEDAAAKLAELFVAAPADPMTPEWIAVPSVGMRRWLSLELARHLGAGGRGAGDGVAGNIRYAFPGALRSRVLAAPTSGPPPTNRGGTTGSVARSAEDPWSVEHLAWAVLSVADAHAGDPHLAALTSGTGGTTRYGAARRIADLFDRYHLHRPDMVRAWAGGHDLDGAGRRLAAHHRWQPHLWRLVRARLGCPSPPERLPDLLAALRTGTLEVDLPPRVVLFGLTVLPGGPGFVELAEALAVHREVHLFLLEPSAQAGRRVAAAVSPSPSGLRLRTEDRSAEAVTHPLLRSWGRLQRETAVLIEDARRNGLPTPRRHDAAGPESPHGHDGSPTGAPGTLLEALQADLRADRAPGGDRRSDPTDASIQFHACHGPARQVEVLRDALLHLLADPTLDLREDDVVVMCPALERFAPLLEAAWGPPALGAGATPIGDDGAATAAPAGPPSLRYRIADRSLGASNPLLEATGALLDLLAGRFEAPAVLDFLALAPVRTRFGFDDDDLARIADWVSGGRIRWGLHPEHREAFDLPASISTNTWRAGADRLLAGTAVHDDGMSLTVGDVAPLAVDPQEADLAGRLADLLWRLDALVDDIAEPRPPHGWVELLRRATTDLFAVTAEDGWQLRALRRVLADVAAAATLGGTPTPTEITFADLRTLLRDHLRAAPGHPDFFRGGITVTSTTPLRWVPYRVVALLGMDQEALAPGRVDGDDLAAASPRLGDRDPRADLRQSLLEAVLAAGDRLIVVRDGNDPRTNQPVPAPVAVAELIDTVLAMHHAEERGSLARRLEIHHPRQAYDERCFRPGALASHTTAPWSFDPAALGEARTRHTRTRPSGGAFVDPPLEPDPATDVSLDELHRFLRRPVRAFFEQRLGVRLPRPGEAPSATLPTSLGGLHGWEVGDRLLRALLAGHGSAEWVEVERRLGTLPPGVLGDAELDQVVDAAERLLRAAEAAGLRRGAGTPVPVDVTLADGTRITGTVLDRLDPQAPGPARVGYSRGRPEHHLAAWLDLLALVATHPDRPWRSLSVHRPPKRDADPDVVLVAPRGDDPTERHRLAIGALEVVVDLLRRGRREPIPLFPTLSHALATGAPPAGPWRDDRADDAVGLAYGELDLDELLAVPARHDDPPGAGGRVERFAHRLWDAVAATSVDLGPTPVDTDGPDGHVRPAGARRTADPAEGAP
jgi:exodeoxyribonuclease V gamma subunit